MSYTFAALQAEYTALLQHMVITREDAVDATARKLLGFVDQNRYAAVSIKTGVPQIVMAASFEREASSNFRLSPAQGDPWDRRSIHVPAGRGPYPDWEAAAEDAYHIDRLDAVGAPNWSWELSCYEEEIFNGFGPRNHGRHTGYLWAGTSIYAGGKYIEDGVWSPTAIDQQLGVIPMMFRMVQLRPSLDLPIPFPKGTVVGLPPAPHYNPTATHDTQSLQQALNQLGTDPQLDVDGNYGRMTRNAVIAFQTAHGLTADGLAGPDTWSAILNAEAA